MLLPRRRRSLLQEPRAKLHPPALQLPPLRRHTLHPIPPRSSGSSAVPPTLDIYLNLFADDMNPRVLK
ncbi:hypothetical protein GALMADRAFT_232699 [Galerina marginata CBS 339.88]|uniref:Uncharacterized protein n=1 Tax=Galerina marginata (strain CBS 339.88) TaxID=685588 RepID=A0A067S5U0_GALM3|nr:hypothetical protein GALMADRAFT_232699 [Galerina marginata CBS 339.88]